jgi:putative membrane protein
MKLILPVILAGFAIGGTALAQTSPPSSSTTPPAVATGNGDTNTTAAPVPGKNSFTEAQAKHRLRKHGYTAIGALKQDDKSIWRGTATKDGKTVDVAVDYQGNIVGQ